MAKTQDDKAKNTTGAAKKPNEKVQNKANDEKAKGVGAGDGSDHQAVW